MTGSRYTGLVPAVPLTRETAIELIVASGPEIRAVGAQRLALIGSVVRGEARSGSDVDILVQFSPGAKTYDRFLAPSELLEARPGRTVDLVTIEALSPFLGPHILAERLCVNRPAYFFLTFLYSSRIACSCRAWDSAWPAYPSSNWRSIMRPFSEWFPARSNASSGNPLSSS